MPEIKVKFLQLFWWLCLLASLTPSLAASPLTFAASPSLSLISHTTESTKEQKFLRSEQIETVLRFVLTIDDFHGAWHSLWFFVNHFCMQSSKCLNMAHVCCLLYVYISVYTDFPCCVQFQLVCFFFQANLWLIIIIKSACKISFWKSNSLNCLTIRQKSN